MQELNLKEITQPYHDDTENLNFTDKMKDGSLSEEEYKSLILRNFYINRYVENKATDLLSPSIESRLDYPKRKKTSILKREMEALKINDYSFPVELIKPSYNKNSIMGAIYVLEGSTLGGQYIKKSLSETPYFHNYYKKIDVPFFGCYGKDTGRLWKSFKVVLENYANQHECHQEIRQGAKDTFNFFIEVSKTVKY